MAKDKELKKLREDMAEVLGVSEEEVSNAMNELAMIDNRFVHLVKLVGQISEGMVMALVILNYEIWQQKDIKDKAKKSFVYLNIYRAIKNTIRKNVPKSQFDEFFRQLREECEREEKSVD